MDKKAVCEALKGLRASRPEYVSYRRFTEVSGIHRATVESTENGLTLPAIDTIEKWVTACGSTLSKFFQQFESRPRSLSDHLHTMPGHDGMYNMLTRIIQTTDLDRINSIRVVLSYVSGELPVKDTAGTDSDSSPPANKLEQRRR